MGDTFRKVQPGQRLTIPAEAYNAFVDVALAHRRKQRGQENDGAPEQPANGCIVLLKNDSGYDLDQFQIIGINGPIITPDENEIEFKSRVMLSGAMPSTEHVAQFAVLQEPLKSGSIGRAAVAGVTLVKVDVQNEQDIAAEVVSGQVEYLKGGLGGSARILWKENGTGVKWAVVRLANPAAAVVVTLMNPLTGEGVTDSGISVQIIASRQSMQALAQGDPRKMLGVCLGTTTDGRPDVQVDSIGWGVSNYMGPQMNNGVRVWDYPRAHQ